jgi:hypothetical protein
MTDAARPSRDERARQLAEALRANLRRRKTRARSASAEREPSAHRDDGARDDAQPEG